MTKYPTKIYYNNLNNYYSVNFPDLPGCYTVGNTYNDALSNARKALIQYLESMNFEEIFLLDPSALIDENVHYIFI